MYLVSSSGCSRKDRAEAILPKCQELLPNVIYSEDSGTIVLDLIFLRTLLNDLEIRRSGALEPIVNEETLSLECVPAIKKHPKDRKQRRGVKQSFI